MTLKSFLGCRAAFHQLSLAKHYTEGAACLQAGVCLLFEVVKGGIHVYKSRRQIVAVVDPVGGLLLSDADTYSGGLDSITALRRPYNKC